MLLYNLIEDASQSGTKIVLYFGGYASRVQIR